MAAADQLRRSLGELSSERRSAQERAAFLLTGVLRTRGRITVDRLRTKVLEVPVQLLPSIWISVFKYMWQLPTHSNVVTIFIICGIAFAIESEETKGNILEHVRPLLENFIVNV